MVFIPGFDNLRGRRIQYSLAMDAEPDAPGPAWDRTGVFTERRSESTAVAQAR